MRTYYLYSLHRHADGRKWPARQFSDKHVALDELSTEAGESLVSVEPGARSGSFTLKRFINQRGRTGELLEDMLAIRTQDEPFTSNAKTVVVEKVNRTPRA